MRDRLLVAALRYPHVQNGMIDERQFLANIQRLLKSTWIAGPHGPALLIALAELAGEQDHESADPLRITTEAIAPKIIAYYWRDDDPSVIVPAHVRAVRNATGQTDTLARIEDQRQRCRGSLAAALMDEAVWRLFVADISHTIQVPLGRLQQADRRKLDGFLFKDNLTDPDVPTTYVVMRPGIALAFRHARVLIQDAVAWMP